MAHHGDGRRGMGHVARHCALAINNDSSIMLTQQKPSSVAIIASLSPCAMARA
jgi:hypothetical protein